MKKPNLLILGASGGVANALLHHMPLHRNIFGKLFLLDKNKKVLTDEFIDHKSLDYKFIHHEIILPDNQEEYMNILKKNKIDIVLDITDYESIPLIELTNKCGVKYVNTALNSEKETVTELVYNLYSRKSSFNKAQHIFCTGMNPGCVNMWVAYGIEKYGLPKEITHFENDTSREADGWHPMMTWSLHEFIVESIRDPSGYALGKDKVKHLYPDALKHKLSLKPILSPIVHLNKYPEGLIVLHEENVTIAQKFNIPSKFIYAVNNKTLDFLEKVYRQKHNVAQTDLDLGDNTKKVLDGSDSVGVMLDYPDKKVYYLNIMPNISFIGTNATYTQVIVGIFAALFTLIFDKLKPGAYFTEDLINTHYKYYLFDNMRVREFVFDKKGKRISYIPEIRLKRDNHFEHLYIL
jgi:hypothetical protein